MKSKRFEPLHVKFNNYFNRPIPNAKYFDEYESVDNPCFKQVCYPMNEYPYYLWEERFQFDKCCQHHEHNIGKER